MWMRLLLMKTLSKLVKDLEDIFNSLNNRLKSKTSKSLQQWFVECVTVLAYTLTLAISILLMFSAIVLVFIYVVIAHTVELSIKAGKEFYNHMKDKEWQNKQN
mgnify:CR=1 FL=1